MKLSVCVVNHYSEDKLYKFLESWEFFRPDFLFEFIVVDNGSGDEAMAEKLVRMFGPKVQVIRPGSNIGFGSAMNRAVREAKGEYILVANPDLELIDNSIGKLLEFADKMKDFGVIGPRLIHVDGRVQESARRFPRFIDLIVNRLPGFRKSKGRYLMRSADLNSETKVDWMVGAALLMKRDRILEMKGFDERFFLFFEDTDLCRRIKQAGHDIWYYPGAVFLHAEKRLSERGFWPFKKVFWIHLASALKYYRKWGLR